MPRQKTYYLIMHNCIQKKGVIHGNLIYLCHYRKDAQHALLTWGYRPMFPASVFTVKSKFSFEDAFKYFLKKADKTRVELNKNEYKMREIRFEYPNPNYISCFTIYDKEPLPKVVRGK